MKTRDQLAIAALLAIVFWPRDEEAEVKIDYGSGFQEPIVATYDEWPMGEFY